jgi:hypothetical protein
MRQDRRSWRRDYVAASLAWVILLPWAWRRYVPSKGRAFCELSIYLSICLWLYSPFVGPWPVFSYLIFHTVGRTPWTGDQPVTMQPPAHTGQHKHRINAHRHPRLKWDSNKRSQCLSGRRRFMPQTARPLWSASCELYRVQILKSDIFFYFIRTYIALGAVT